MANGCASGKHRFINEVIQLRQISICSNIFILKNNENAKGSKGTKFIGIAFSPEYFYSIKICCPVRINYKMGALQFESILKALPFNKTVNSYSKYIYGWFMFGKIKT